MTAKQLRELEQLVSDLYDDGLSSMETQRLEGLLLDEPALQDKYLGMVDLHVGLSVAGESLANPSSDEEQSDTVSTIPAHLSMVRGFVAILATTACILLAVWIWHGWDFSDLPSRVPELASHADHKLSAIPTIKCVSWNGTTFSQDVDDWQPLSVVGPGVIPLRQSRGEMVDGYLLELPPGYRLELVTTCDATAENCLSIEEVWAGTTPSSRKVTFHNSGQGSKPRHANPAAKHRRFGIVGTWADRNVTQQPRFFLVTAVHKRVDPGPNEAWRVSEMAVMIEEPDVIQIGWDDSGPAPSTAGDEDFDDLSASIFIVPIGQTQRVTPVTPELEVAAAQVPTADPDAAPAIGSTAYEMMLPPGSITLFKAASNASAHNELFLRNAKDGNVLWSASNNRGKSSNVGGVALRNRSDSFQRIYLMSSHRNPDVELVEPSSASRYCLLFEQTGYNIVGFDDGVRPDADFDDVRVGILQFDSQIVSPQ